VLCIQVYGYDEIIINASENMNKVLTLCEQYYLCIAIFFAHDKYMVTY
jgi:hypothetical protein